MSNNQLIFLAFMLAGLAGCNTINGMGKDFQKAGAKIKDVSKPK